MKKINVLLLGDSVRMFYREAVAKELGEEYHVYSPDENCRFSGYVLNSLRLWLPQYPTPDIIHFNAGLWDTAVLYPEDGCFAPKEEYTQNMRKILRELKKSGATLIFATTTPVHDRKQFLKGPVPPAHSNQDITEYNRSVLQAYKNENVRINDLFSLMYPEREKYLSEDMIHPNEDGVQLLAKAVANAVRECGHITNNTRPDRDYVVAQSEKTVQ